MKNFVGVLAIIIVIMITLAGAFGYVNNIITVFNSVDSVLTAKTVVRIIGIFIVPLGAILGWV